MATTFGRRAGPQARAQPAKAIREPAAAEAKLPWPSAFENGPDAPSLDDELREWKRNRKSGFQIPWAQLSLMASLCFGIASFVLPDGTNEVVNWLLYALMAVSFIAGISRRRRKRAETARAA
ncbi:MAG: hypothetical protein JSR55_05305 [Proteobacteria bacterium]|nr:hypothetical protein [Pseudomonadota bacterium]